MAEKQTLLALAKAISVLDIKKCHQPFGIFAQETSDLALRAKIDAPHLTAVGLPQEVIDNLTIWAQLIQEAQSRVKNEDSEAKKAQQAWNKEYAVAKALCKDLLKQEKFAFHHDVLILDLLSKVKKHNDYAHVIQDLHTLVEIGRNNRETLLAIGFDTTLLDQTETLANRLTTLRSIINSNRYDRSDATRERGQIFTLAKKDAAEVRRVGQFVYRDDPEHRMLYTSRYERERRAKSRKKSGDENNHD